MTGITKTQPDVKVQTRHEAQALYNSCSSLLLSSNRSAFVTSSSYHPNEHQSEAGTE